MSIVVNGTTIPTNVANVLNVNGTNITSVVCDGVTVWTQSLFSALWSGNAIITTALGSEYFGMEVSSSLYRAYLDPVIGGNYYGQWQSVSMLGIFSGDSITHANMNGISVSNNLMRTIYDGAYSPTWVTFTLLTKAFTGSASVSVWYDGDEVRSTFNTSGGLLRYGQYNPTNGQAYSNYISLT